MTEPRSGAGSAGATDRRRGCALQTKAPAEMPHALPVARPRCSCSVGSRSTKILLPTRGADFIGTERSRRREPAWMYTKSVSVYTKNHEALIASGFAGGARHGRPRVVCEA